MEQIYRENNRIGRNVTPLAKQKQILDLAGKKSDLHIARVVGVSASTVGRIRRDNGIPIASEYKQYKTRGTQRARPDDVLYKARLLTAKGHLTMEKIVKRLGVSMGWYYAHCSFIAKYSGALGLVRRPNALSNAEADNLIRDCYLINWRRSDELRRYTHFLKKWKYVRRLCSG